VLCAGGLSAQVGHDRVFNNAAENPGCLSPFQSGAEDFGSQGAIDLALASEGHPLNLHALSRQALAGALPLRQKRLIGAGKVGLGQAGFVAPLQGWPIIAAHPERCSGLSAIAPSALGRSRSERIDHNLARMILARALGSFRKSCTATTISRRPSMV
jgi:hypothetical protein